MFDIKKIREDFPALHQIIYKKPLVYFDNAATTQKPNCVIETLKNYYEKQNSNIHRGVHYLSQQATTAYEEARKTVQQFINAEKSHEIIFTRGTTESINLVASSFIKKFLKAGDEVLITAMEHHSNIVPWQIGCEEKIAKLKVIPFDENGELQMDAFEKLLNEKVKIVAITHVSNALGTVNPVKEIIKKAHQKNIPVLVDGAQSLPHMKVDVQDLDCDFYCFSGHKMYAPMGVGVLYGKEKWLEELPPYQGGGEMIKEVTFERTTYNELPFKFEAGTPNVGDGLGLETAIKYLTNIGLENIFNYEDELLTYANKKLSEIEGLRFIGNAKEKKGVASFLIGNIHPYDLGTILDKLGIAVRTGHHCAQPVMDFYKIPGTVRASFALYNTKEEVDILIEGIKKAKDMLE
ncbi:MAG TPA: cysteine desulfurase [Bacteroidales bacterium]|nr:cysteine desulfurase [Bacteroidales bacterium]HPS16485.1 cysteine desulfurase [Bacteroidales bacterium]